jgi:hypothetical protein
LNMMLKSIEQMDYHPHLTYFREIIPSAKWGKRITSRRLALTADRFSRILSDNQDASKSYQDFIFISVLHAVSLSSA